MDRPDEEWECRKEWEYREERELLASCVGEVPPFLMGGSSLLGKAVVEAEELDLS